MRKQRGQLHDVNGVGNIYCTLAQISFGDLDFILTCLPTVPVFIKTLSLTLTCFKAAGSGRAPDTQNFGFACLHFPPCFACIHDVN